MDEISIKEVPDKMFYVDDKGFFSSEIKSNKKMENSQYWANKNVQIGLLMLTTMFILIMTLLAETDILNFFWSKLWGA
jgi:hypothetical protein